jgi:Leucine-rich repeat (LRR) protein
MPNMESIDWIAMLSRVPYLSLALCGNGLESKDLLPLVERDELHVLYLSRNRIEDTSVVGKLPCYGLSLSDNLLTELTDMEHSNELRELRVDGNEIHSLDVFKSGFENLEILDLSGNPVDDLTPLYGLRLLRNLYLLDMPHISQEQREALQEALPNCEIHWD